MTANNIIPFRPGAVSAKALAAFGGADNTLGAGITQGFAVMKYKGKVWTIQHKGASTPLMRPNNDGPMNSINVAIVAASTVIGKIFYEKGFVENSNNPPDCFSVNGVTPDVSSHKKQAQVCKLCPHDAWGSHINDAGAAGKGKRCRDSKRLAIVPASPDSENADLLRNEALGGPMLLRVPAGTLKALAAYGDLLKSTGYPHQAVVTKISFDSAQAHPTFLFEPVRPLTDAEIDVVVELSKLDHTARVLAEDGQMADEVPAQAAPVAPAQAPVVTPQVTTPTPPPPPTVAPPVVATPATTAAPVNPFAAHTTGTPPAPQPVATSTPTAQDAQATTQANSNFEAELDRLIG